MSVLDAIGLAKKATLLLDKVVRVCTAWKETFGEYTKITIELEDLQFQLRRVDGVLTQEIKCGRTSAFDCTIDLKLLEQVLLDTKSTVANLPSAQLHPQKSFNSSRRRNWEKLLNGSPLENEHERRVQATIGDLEHLLVSSASRLDSAFWRPKQTLPRQTDPWHGQLILSLDGGGIRGYASLMMLKYLVREIANVEHGLDPSIDSSFDSPLFHIADDESFREDSAYGSVDDRPHWDNFRLCHYFDCMVGSSTGGIIAVMLGTMRSGIMDAMQYNHEIWKGLDPTFARITKRLPMIRSRTDNTNKWRTSVTTTLGESGSPGAYQNRLAGTSWSSVTATMRTKPGECQTIVFVSQKTGKGVTRPYAIRSYELSDDDKKQRKVMNAGVDTTRVSIVDACLATSAAPAYFKRVEMTAVEGEFRDGTISRSSAAEHAYREFNNRSDTKRSVQGLLSIGSSRTPESRYNYGTNVLSPEEKDFFVRTRLEEEDFMYDRIRCDTYCKPSHKPDKMLNRIELEINELCRGEDVRELIAEWARVLVDIRRRRSRTAQWASYAGLRVTGQEREQDLYDTTRERQEQWRDLKANGGNQVQRDIAENSSNDSR